MKIIFSFSNNYLLKYQVYVCLVYLVLMFFLFNISLFDETGDLGMLFSIFVFVMSFLFTYFFPFYILFTDGFLKELLIIFYKDLFLDCLIGERILSIF